MHDNSPAHINWNNVNSYYNDDIRLNINNNYKNIFNHHTKGKNFITKTQYLDNQQQ